MVKSNSLTLNPKYHAIALNKSNQLPLSTGC